MAARAHPAASVADERVGRGLAGGVDPAGGIDREAFCEALSRVPTGLTVVTTINGDGLPHATTVSAFCSLSLDPPLVLVALARTSELLRHVCRSARFGVNVLAGHQQDAALACGRKGAGKLAELDWHVDSGLPRLEHGAVWLACETRDLLPGGDHMIVVGHVTACETGADEPLVFHRRRFHRLPE